MQAFIQFCPKLFSAVDVMILCQIYETFTSKNFDSTRLLDTLESAQLLCVTSGEILHDTFSERFARIPQVDLPF